MDWNGADLRHEKEVRRVGWQVHATAVLLLKYEMPLTKLVEFAGSESLLYAEAGDPGVYKVCHAREMGVAFPESSMEGFSYFFRGKARPWSGAAEFGETRA